MKRTKKAFMLVMVAALSLTLGLLTACGESYEKQTIDVTDGKTPTTGSSPSPTTRYSSTRVPATMT